MLENAKVGDEVIINHGTVGVVVEVDHEFDSDEIEDGRGVLVTADWDDTGVIYQQWCRYNGRAFGFENINHVTEVVK